ATRGVLFARQDLHERGLARPVRAGNGIAAPGHESCGHILEEDARAEAHGDVFDSDHNPLILAYLACPPKICATLQGEFRVEWQRYSTAEERQLIVILIPHSGKGI